MPATLVATIILSLAAVLKLRSRMATAVASTSLLAFVALAAVALAATLLPGAFDRLADRTLAASGVRGRIVELDERLVLNDLADVSGELVSAAEALSSDSGSILDVASRLREALSAARDSRPSPPDHDAQHRSQVLFYNLYPGLVGVTSVVLRLGALVASLTGLVAVTSIHLVAVAQGEVKGLRETNEALVTRVTALEARLFSVGGHDAPDQPPRT